MKSPDGTLVLTLPMGDKKLPGIAADDIGKSAYAVFKKGLGYVGKRVGIAGEHLTGAAARAFNPGMQTFDGWLSRNKDRIPME